MTVQEKSAKSNAAETRKTEAPAQASNKNNTPGSAISGMRTEPAAKARMKPRHRFLVASFILLVLIPMGATYWYLYFRAVDQFASSVGFSVRSEDTQSSLDVLSGLAAFGSSSSDDTDMLYEYIRSRDIVEDIDDKLDLREKFSRYYQQDPIFSFNTDGTIEDLHQHWEWMVSTSYDRGTGLIEVRVNAFDPDDAKSIADELLLKGTALVNELSSVAREDASRYAREELDRSVERLKEARTAITEFRTRHQLVDPLTEIGVQTGLISALQNQLSAVMVEYNLLNETLSEGDPRLIQMRQRIDVIRDSIDSERRKFSAAGSGGQNYSALMGEYEGLVVDREFAETAYVAALAAFDQAQVEAQRQTRYLTAYVKPKAAETAEYPKRLTFLLIVSAALFFLWGMFTVIYYIVRDRR